MVSEKPSSLKSALLLDATLKVYRENFLPLILLSAASLLPSYLKDLLLTLSSETVLNNWEGDLIGLVLSAWILLPMIGMILITNHSRQNEPSIKFWQALKLGRPLWKKAIIPQLLSGLMTSEYLLTLIPYIFFMPDDRQTYKILAVLIQLTGFIVYSYTYFAIQAAAVRGKSNLEAMRHSFRLVKDQWWYTFWHILGFSFPLILPILIAYPIFQAIAPDSMAVQLSLSQLLVIFILPLGNIFFTLLFFKLEDRKRDYFGEGQTESA